MTLHEMLTQDWWPVAMLKLFAIPLGLIITVGIMNALDRRGGKDVGDQLGDIAGELAELNDRLRIQFPDKHERDLLRHGIDPYGEE